MLIILHFDFGASYKNQHWINEQNFPDHSYYFDWPQEVGKVIFFQALTYFSVIAKVFFDCQITQKIIQDFLRNFRDATNLRKEGI
jgi:hypothetical protein